jgi:hypothetical protein
MRWEIGDRALLLKKHPVTVVDCFTHRGRTTYSVQFDDSYFARIPPQTAIGVREEELEAMAEAAGEYAVSSRRPPSEG